MTSRWRSLVRLLAQSRLELAFPAIANNWLVIFLARRLENNESVNPVVTGEPLWIALLLGTIVAAGLSIYGLVLNDVMDARHDRAFSPERPIPAGRMGPRGAIALAIMALLAGFGAAVYLGTESGLLCVLAAVATLFYNGLGKFFPGVGITTLGLIWAAGMAIPNPRMGFAWPVWLTMTHVMACAVAVHLIEGKRPRLHAAEWLWVGGGWTFWTFVLVLWIDTRNSNYSEVAIRPGMWKGPLVAILALGLATWWTFHGKMNQIRMRRRAGEHFRHLAMLWLIAYDAAWALSAGELGPGLVLLGLFGVALLSMRLGAALENLAEPPPTYRVRATLE